MAVVCAAVGALSLGVLTSSNHAALIVDDFTMVGSPNPWPVELFTETSVTIDESGLNTLGGSRITYVEATDIGLPDVDSVNVNISAGAGTFGYFSSSDAIGFVSLLYNGNGSLDADFSGQSAVVLNFSFFDFANSNPLPITVLLSDGTNTASHTVSLTSAGAQAATFNFADFANIGALDMASIQSIEFELDPGLAADFQIANIVVTPTPGALALLGIAGIIGSRRRRN